MAEQKRDYYEVLGVDKNADEAAIKKAYRVLAKKYHPDMNPGDAAAEKKFKEASEAYAVLSDPDKKRQYDQFGHAAFEGGAGGAGGFDFSGMDFSDIVGDIFSDFFGGGRRSSARRDGPMRGDNIRTSVRLKFEEAVFGCRKEIVLNTKETCKTCNGSGAKPGSSAVTCSRCKGRGQITDDTVIFFSTMRTVKTCPDCQGTGKVVKEKCTDCGGRGYIAMKKRYSVDIPAGVDNGYPLVQPGLGDPGINGGPRGDAHIEIIVENHPIFRRRDFNIYSTVSISYAVAALGGEIFVDTVDGKKVVCKVEPGTQTDSKQRLAGKGVPIYGQGGARGNHIVTLVVEVPEKLKPEAAELLRQFDALTGDSLNAVKNASENPDDGDNNGKDGKKKKFWK